MKKVMFVFAVATMLVACGGNASVETTNTDSTVVADSVSVADSSITATDTTVAQIGGGSSEAEVKPSTPAVK
jgi:uncharacterized protein YcfL